MRRGILILILFSPNEQDWPLCKVVFFMLAPNTLNVRNNTNSSEGLGAFWFFFKQQQQHFWGHKKGRKNQEMFPKFPKYTNFSSGRKYGFDSEMQIHDNSTNSRLFSPI